MASGVAAAGTAGPDKKTATEEEEEEKGAADDGNGKEGPAAAQPLERPRHPLHNAWTLWFFKNDRARRWEDNQRPVVTFRTVEEFWSLHNNIEVPSKLSVGCDYSLFKAAIAPMWEDKSNRAGGRWIVVMNRAQRATHLDAAWRQVALCLIGECLGDSLINGAVVSLRNRVDRISVWLAECSHKGRILDIGKKLKQRLAVVGETAARRGPNKKHGGGSGTFPGELTFDTHEDTMRKSGSLARHKYVL